MQPPNDIELFRCQRLVHLGVFVKCGGPGKILIARVMLLLNERTKKKDLLQSVRTCLIRPHVQAVVPSSRRCCIQHAGGRRTNALGHYRRDWVPS